MYSQYLSSKTHPSAKNAGLLKETKNNPGLSDEPKKKKKKK